MIQQELLTTNAAVALTVSVFHWDTGIIGENDFDENRCSENITYQRLEDLLKKVQIYD